MAINKIYLKVSKDDSGLAYLYFPDHPGEGKKGVVDKQIILFDIIENYKGPDLYLDIDHDGRVIGVEIIA